MNATAAMRADNQDSSQYYAWRFPGAPVNIYLQLNTVARLREYVFSGLRSDNVQSVEVGGLLLGKIRPQHIEVTGFIRFELDSSSRYFVLNAGEKIRFLDAIKNGAATDKEASVVGYFRSSLRGGLRLFDDDLALIKEYFPEPDNVFLIVDVDTDPPLAGFFFWDSDEVFPDASFMPVPLDERSLEPSPIHAPRRESAILHAEPTSAQLEKRRSRWPIAITAAVVATIAAATPFVYTRLPIGAGRPSVSSLPVSTAPAANSPAAPLSLSGGLLRDSHIEITWDTAAIPKMRVGVLTITDGEARRELPLTQAQLESRKLIYAPTSNNVEVALEVFSTDGASTRESVFFLLLAPTTRAAAKPDLISQASKTSASAVTPRDFVPPVTYRPDTNFSVEPPSLQAVTAALGSANPPGFVPSAPAASSVAVPARQIPSSISSPIVGEMPQPTVRDTASTTPPRPLRQVQPLLPRDLASTLARRVDIQIRTFVDANGKVVSTEMLENTVQNGVERFLATAALQAARLWTFTPAMRGTEKIPGVIVLQFTFGADRAAPSKSR